MIKRSDEERELETLGQIDVKRLVHKRGKSSTYKQSCENGNESEPAPRNDIGFYNTWLDGLKCLRPIVLQVAITRQRRDRVQLDFRHDEMVESGGMAGLRCPAAQDMYIQRIIGWTK